jgi:alginate O-acetyltransferase complex protein AlgI
VLFCTYKFALFFCAVFAVYWATPWPRARIGVLLLASATFYAIWNPWLTGLVLASSTADFLLARGIEATASPGRKRLLVGVSLAFNLGLLGYLKYANFFLRSIEAGAAAAGCSATLPVLNVIVPIGISFYTFEAISYILDVFGGRVRAERNLAHFLLFILFFPHLVAGPIVRARDFLPQVGRIKRWNWTRAEVGLRLILLGAVKKLAVADRLGLYADPIFADPAKFGTLALWLGAVACAVQIYCDFSGYSDIALGLAHLLGFHLAQNFDRPFMAANVAEFWRRWHISLSSWLRDYVFVPLGGSRAGRWTTYRNVIVVMILAGLWHGAGWNYILFGLAQGLLLVGHRLFREWCQGRSSVQASLQSAAGTGARIAATFASFVLTLVIFRTTSMAATGVMLGRMLRPATGAGLTLAPWGLTLTLAAVALAHVTGGPGRFTRLQDLLPRPMRGLAFGALAAFAMVLAPPGNRLFVYFQF